MKLCKACAQTKPLSEFHKDNRTRGLKPSRGGFGVATVCKRCRAEARKPGIHAERIAREKRRKRGLKPCGRCHEAKPLADFGVRRASPDGLAHTCKECVKERSHQWRLDHPGAHQQWYQENKEHKAVYWAAWQEKNKERTSANYKAWATANKDRVTALSAKRKAIKRSAVAPWIDHDAVRAIYAEAARLTAETGVRHEVDHVIPLQGELVCGLHWEGNLQVLTKVENIRKSNRFDTGVSA